MNKVVVMLKGGLGNQIFCYAAARRLALANDAELVIDDVTGFVRDHLYRRTFMLDRFNISARRASPRERFEPLGRYRRKLARILAKRKSFPQRRYVEQERLDFDQRLVDFRFTGSVYLDGYWQSEQYFKNAEDVIRSDLAIAPPTDAANREMAERIRSVTAVCIHVRWFEKPQQTGDASHYNLESGYYPRAVQRILAEVPDPRFFVFSDDIPMARRIAGLPEQLVTYVSHNQGDAHAYADLWLMAQCKHFIIANSTFSWWGAWLGGLKQSMVVCPSIKMSGTCAWGFDGLIPDRWFAIP